MSLAADLLQQAKTFSLWIHANPGKPTCGGQSPQPIIPCFLFLLRKRQGLWSVEARGRSFYEVMSFASLAIEVWQMFAGGLPGKIPVREFGKFWI